MSGFVFDRAAYCSLLRLAELPPVSAEGLRELHRAQCFAIPFENIEPFLGRPVPLDLSFLQEKFLRRGRGGYCFELNSYFGEVLRVAGFSARALLGRVWMGRPVGGGRTHLVNIVRLGDRDWIADVGFGGPGILEPIPYEAGWEGEQAGRRLRLFADERWGLLYQDWFEGAWRTIYSLAEEMVQEIDIRQGNHYCATHPDSIFVKHLYCSRPRREGERVTLLAQGPVENLAGVLSEDFGISLAPADLAALMTRLHVTGATN